MTGPAGLKKRVREARVKASLSVNQELIRLYWGIGRSILERQKSSHWGDKVLDKLAMDLRREFPDMKEFSRTNLKYMRMFAQAYPEFGQQPVDRLPWGTQHGIGYEDAPNSGGTVGG